MKMSDKQIKNLLKVKNISDISSDIVDYREKIDTCVIKSTRAFYECEAQRSLTRVEFLYQQSRYIHKRWWVLQGIILLLIWCIMKYSNSDYYARTRMGIMAPLFVVLIMPELWKNRYTNAVEVECAAYFSLRQIYAARMILFALVDLLLLTAFSLTAVYTTQLSLREIMVQFFLPFNVTCCICFQTMYNKWFRSEILSMLLCMLWSVVWMLIVLKESIYNVISVPIWNILLIMSALYFGYCIYRGQRECNGIWEVEQSWN